MRTLRLLSIIIGAAVLASATWTAIESAGLDGAHAWLVASLALGTAGGAIVIAHTSGRVAVLVVGAVICGELFGMLATAERIIKAREAVAGVVVDAKGAARERDKRIAEARADLARHDTDALAEISKRTCAAECRKLMEGTRAKLESALQAARDMEVPVEAARSASPLADRLGIAPWALDLIAAACMTIGANGLAVILIAWGAHGPVTHGRPNVTHDDANGRVSGPQAPEIVTDGRGNVTQPSNVTPFKRKPAAPAWGTFALEALEPSKGARVAVKDVIDAYRAWLQARGAPIPPASELVDDIDRVFRAARIKTDADGATIYALNVKVAGKG